MSRHIAVVAALCAAVTLIVAASGPSAAVGDCTPQASWGTLDRTFAQQVLGLVNQHRAGLGLGQLTSSPSLTAAAEWKSLHMAGIGYFAHNDQAPPVARTVGDRLVACGYPSTAGWGENIAYGYTTPAAVMQGWLNSAGHRANIERATFRSLGVGVARNSSGRLYWTQDFGTSTAGAATPSPPPPPSPPPADAQAPSVPTGLAVTSATQTSIGLRWNASTDNSGVAGYGVYVGTTRVGTASGTSATLTGRTCGTSYSIGVDAYDASGNRSGRAVVTAATSPCSTTTPPPPPPPPPSPPPPSPPPPSSSDTTAPSAPPSFSVVAKTPTSITVTWAAATDNVGVTGYQLYRFGVLVASTTSLTYTYTGLTCGPWQVLTVKARDAAGNLSPQRQIFTPLAC